MLHAPLADLRGEQRAETVPPEPYRFVVDINAAFEQDVLDLAERWRM